MVKWVVIHMQVRVSYPFADFTYFECVPRVGQLGEHGRLHKLVSYAHAGAIPIFAVSLQLELMGCQIKHLALLLIPYRVPTLQVIHCSVTQGLSEHRHILQTAPHDHISPSALW